MINIVIPMAGIKPFNEDAKNQYPLPLIEIQGKPLIQYVMDNLNTLNEEKQFIFILSESDCNKYHIDNTLRQLSNNCLFIPLKNKTKGAVCSVLMAIDIIDPHSELLIVNSDQVIEIDYNKVLAYFRNMKTDGGVISFNSVHPRWSFIRTEKELVTETTEKNPISNQAIAGFYYFKKGVDFTNASFQAIYHDANLEGNYYTSSVFNEMILENKKIVHYPIDNNCYHSFYSPQKLREFEEFLIK